ncbi:hypothetical protein EXIGLDRAFT_730290 [Exidia glandulosa HHB12029]|uniref:Cysteine-rich protein n=1 Tax=Exidia glandulosa HHB12029 TaxID=1314781 RepID=A0A165LBD6_EXIGL|nr:hypothetical protein EXIGLDRAFT_730290 [Exidia glandulosa HHB12029]
MKPSRIVLPLTLVLSANAGLIAYGICQTGCNMGAVACYAVAGAVFGTVAAPTAPAAILACNAAQGMCMATLCAPLLLIPFP